MFAPDQDLYAWRKKVATWADFIKYGADKGEDRQIKTIWATLAQNLYESLPDEQRMVIDHALEQDKEFSLHNPDQMEAVQQIVDKIAKDPPTTVVTRLMNSFVKVQNCKRNKDMSFNSFVSKFMALASEHLIHSGGTSTSQVGEVLAFTLLNNANLEKATHQTAKMQLIQTAAERQDRQGETLKAFPMTDVDRASIQSSIDKVVKLAEELGSVSDDVDVLKEKIAKTLTVLGELKNSQTEVLKNTELPSSSDFNTEGLRTRITVKSSKPQISLEDAASVVRTLEQNSSRDDRRYATTQQLQQQMQQFQASMMTQMQKIASHYGSYQQAPFGSGGGGRGGRDGSRGGRGGRGGNRGGGRRGRGTRRGQPEYCRDCGSNKHRQGDDSCKNPNFETKKRRKESKEQDDQDNDNGGSDPFRSGGSQNN